MPRSAAGNAQETERRILAMFENEERLRASEAALRASDGALDARENEVERRVGVLRGLGQAILAVLDEASAWLGETIPTSLWDAVSALRRAMERIKPEPELLADEEPGM